jgi:phosphate transport system ATP-binding protein
LPFIFEIDIQVKNKNKPKETKLVGSFKVELERSGNQNNGDESELNTILEVRKLNFYYGNFRALTDINIKIFKNRITSIIGPSGCGKSTFLRCFNRMNELMGEVHADGDVLMNNINIYDRDIDPVRLRRKIGMVFQQPNPFPKSILDNVTYGPKMYGLKNRQKLNDIAVESLKKAAIWDEVRDRLDASALSLSGGQQQRLCIARTIAVEPEIILMDEPASALDPVATMKIEDLMRDLAENYTIIIVTHNMQQAARVSDFTLFFMMDEQRSGILVEHGKTDDIFTLPKDKRTEDYITGRFG